MIWIGPGDAEVAAPTRRGTPPTTECSALLDLSTASPCALRMTMMVRNPSMFPNGKVMDLDMATGWDLDLEWVLDPAWTMEIWIMETCKHRTDGILD